LELESLEPLVIVDRSFLTKCECDAVIAAAKQNGVGFRTSMANENKKWTLSAWPMEEAGLHCELLESVYQRIDDICGPSRSNVESLPKVHYFAPTDSQGPRRMPVGVHVDTNARPFRYVTAIIYLSTILQPAGDGATVFPCAQASSSLKQAAEELLEEQILHTNMAHSDAAMEHNAHVMQQAAEQRQGLSIFPEAGKLAIFFTTNADGAVDPTSWHGGAAVGATNELGGAQAAGKWTLQVFKEVPFGVRSAAALASFVSARRAQACAACG
jgi:hypothetical protein